MRREELEERDWDGGRGEERCLGHLARGLWGGWRECSQWAGGEGGGGAGQGPQASLRALAGWLKPRLPGARGTGPWLVTPPSTSPEIPLPR